MRSVRLPGCDNDMRTVRYIFLSDFGLAIFDALLFEPAVSGWIVWVVIVEKDAGPDRFVDQAATWRRGIRPLSCSSRKSATKRHWGG
jgi:hypothetical protein